VLSAGPTGRSDQLDQATLTIREDFMDFNLTTWAIILAAVLAAGGATYWFLKA